MNKLYVIAGNYREFCDWCREMLVSKNSPLIYYVREGEGVKVLRGLRNAQIICIGTFTRRGDYQELIPLVREARKPLVSVIYRTVGALDKSSKTFCVFGGRKIHWG